ncbi:DNA topoisomerase 3-alpha [Ciona intestinalis]
MFYKAAFKILTYHRKLMPRQASTFKVLSVAEKNDAAKRISDILSEHQYQVRNGFSKYNKIYEFNYQMLGQNCAMSVTSLSGHLLNYNFAGMYKKWHSCHPLSLFDVEVEKIVTENMVDIKRTLEREVRNSQALVIWTDCDREGENIGFEIINICRNIKRNIPVYRARFSEITDRSIKSACRNLQQPDQNTSDAVDVRQELDLRIGAAFTRFQTLRLQKVFPHVLSDKLISYGSCQFPTLGFVVERYKAREQFQPEDFWKIEVTHTTTQHNDDGPVTSTFSWKRNRLFNELACRVLYANCMEPPVVATVTNVSSRPRSKWRPVAMETVELEKLASRKLRINAKETMKIAETLYTQGYISYPRTETNIFPKDFDLERLVGEQSNHPAWGNFARDLLSLEGGPQPRNGHKSDQAHPPIHPTKAAPNLSGNNARIYELITRHFLACCHRDAKGHETTVDMVLGGEEFNAQGLMIIERNYLEVYPYDRWNGKIIAVYNIGDEFEPTNINMPGGRTTAPPLLTEADLIALMDKHGIGTDATHAEHIETIKQRMYVGLTSDQRFLPGELGMGLVEGYNLMGYEMSRPELRAELEADLRRICEGTAQKADVLHRHISKYRAVFEAAVQNAQKLDEALSSYFGNATQVQPSLLNPSGVSPPVRPCPVCGKDMIIKTKRDGGYMMSCTGYPDCMNAMFFPSSISEIKVDASVCTTCQPTPVHRVHVKIKPGSVPVYFSLDQVVCIGGCDEDVINALGLRYTNNQHTASNQHNQHRGASNARRGGGPRGGGSRPGAGGFGGNGPRGGGSRPGGGGNGHTGGGPGVLSSRGSRGGFKKGGTRKKSTLAPARGDENVPACQCGEVSIVLTVRKDGPNTGREFYKCGKQNGGCDFFMWVDNNNQTTQQQPSYTSRLNNRFVFRNNDSSTRASGDVMCKCNIPATQRTVQKEGANKGRMFYTCDKPRDTQCGFFEWCDAIQNTAPTPSTSHNQPRAPKRKRPPTCGLCKEVGHTRRGCPNK